MSEKTVSPLDQSIKLDLTAGEVNYLLHALGQRPFGEVANLIGKIKTQGDAQFIPPSLEGAEPSVDAPVN